MDALKDDTMLDPTRGTFNNKNPSEFDITPSKYDYQPGKNQHVLTKKGKQIGAVPYYVDIHCHSTFMSYNRSRTEKTTVDEFWPQVVSQKSVRKQRFKDTPTFTQSDFTTLSRSRVRLVFASLLPLEQGFLWYRGKVIARILARSQMKIPWSRSRRVQSVNHDYFMDLEKEFSLLTNYRNWQCPGDVLATCPRAKVVADFKELSETLNEYENIIAVVITIEGGHSLGCGSIKYIEKINDDELNNVRYGYKNIKFELDDNSFAEPEDRCDIAGRFRSWRVRALVRRLLVNIKKMKNWGNGKFAPLSITFSHHFWNQLCGHAISLPYKDIIVSETANGILPRLSIPIPIWTGANVASELGEEGLVLGLPVFDQTRGIEEPMTEVGKVVVNALLSKNNGKRVLIDTKHMSLAGKDWYYQCIEEFNKDLKDGDKIPVISSHVASSGDKPMLKKASVKDPYEADQNYDKSTKFNPWDINLSDAEIVRIHKSNGLLGLHFDERILAGKKWREQLHEINPNSRRWGCEWTALVAEHIYHVAEVIADEEGLTGSPRWDDNEAQAEKRPWRRLAMGSDFDGAINPMDAYCYVIDYNELEHQLGKCLIDMRDGRINHKYRLDDYSLLKRLNDSNIAQIVDWFMRKNALDFLSMYFSDEYRSCK